MTRFAALLLSLSFLVPAAAEPLPTTAATLEELPRLRTLDGVVEAVQRATVSARITGEVAAVYFDVDEFVSKDKVILRFKDTEQKARVARARAALKEAEARYADAKQEFDRIAGLYREKAVSKADLDRAKAALEAAEARIEAARAALAEAEEQLAHTVVRAPYAGVVIERHVEPGETVRVGQPLMTGLSLEKLRVRVDVPQTVIDAVRARRRAEIIAPDGQCLESDRVTIFPVAHTASHTFRVRVRLPDGRHGLYPGMLVKARFEVGRERRLVIPAQAVAHRSEVTAVYVVDEDGRVHMRQVQLGRRLADGRQEILAGLEAGERVALDPIRAGVVLKQGGAR